MNRFFPILIILAILSTGCRQVAGPQVSKQPPFGAAYGNTQTAANTSTFPFGLFGSSQSDNPIQTDSPEQYQKFSELANQINSLNQRLGSMDSDNQQLQTEIAALQQKLQVANDYNQQLKQQLADNINQFKQLASRKMEAEQKLSQIQQSAQLASSPGQAPTRLVGSASLPANNSLLKKVADIQIAGADTRMDGEVIRVEIPSDRLFSPGSYQVQPTQITTLNNLVAIVRQHFPRQIIGIEAHWDGTPLNPPTTTHHQLTATQSLAVFDELQRQGLPANQMFTMGMGSNQLRHPQGATEGISLNRRIEIVIYPDTIDGN
ncbi:MAG: OmpA family protein [Mariniblastus sp.]|nr:OmpA family protein [Mariniblastus sp.]